MAGEVQGTVKFFKHSGGYGFIKPDDGGPDVFVHGNDLPDGVKLNEGNRVSFVPDEGKKGPKATHLKVLGD